MKIRYFSRLLHAFCYGGDDYIIHKNTAGVHREVISRIKRGSYFLHGLNKIIEIDCAQLCCDFFFTYNKIL